METITIGILGFAHGHVDAYCNRWRENPDWGVRAVAGWDPDAARLAGAAAKHQIVACQSAGALLARSDIQAVVITAETSRHAELVELAAAAGKAIILQKPMALTLAEADRMVAAVERHRVPFTLAWQMRVDPHNLQVRDLLASGKFGKVYMVRRRHCLNTQDWANFDQTWHVQPQLNRDIFADDAAHPIDFLYWLRGRPVSVFAELGTLLNPKVVNDNGIAVFRYADGSFAEVSCTFVAPAGENTLEVVAEKGVIVGNYGDVPSTAARPAGAPQLKWWLKGDGGWKISDLPEIRSQGERIAGLAAPLAEFLHGCRPPIATVHEGREVLRLVEACYTSADEGRRIMINPS
jgi:predicted dehydrogenase